MDDKNILERLAEMNPEAEIWWDSSPLIYGQFGQRVVEEAPPERRNTLREQFQRMYNKEAPERSLFRGVTTNPPLSLQAIQADPDRWQRFVDQAIEEEQGIDAQNLFWKTYREMVRAGAAMFERVFEASNGKYGYISGQVDPRACFDYPKMLEQALDLASLGTNVMIKCPGTKQGYQVIRELTARGIATNNTLSFVLPQFLACAEAVRQGLETARANGVSLHRWRSVITHMTSRFSLLGDLEKEAREAGIALEESDVRWGELAIFKRSYQLLRERGYPSKMLICSKKFGPDRDGVRQLWHIQKLAGGDIVFTCPPPFIEKALKEYDDVPLDPSGIEEQPPEPVLQKLLRLPYFRQGYEEDCLTPEEFNEHPAVKATAKQHVEKTEKMIDFVRQRLHS